MMYEASRIFRTKEDELNLYLTASAFILFAVILIKLIPINNPVLRNLPLYKNLGIISMSC